MKILIINPGSTSTKISLYEDERLIFEESPFHDAPELLKYKTVNEQLPFRKKVILDMLKRNGTDPSEIDVYVGRGGSAYTQPSGVTVIDERLFEDTKNNVGGSGHPAKLGVMLAYELCREYGGQMFTLNPTNVDELCDYARLTGIDGIYRKAQSHVLNQKAVASYHARRMGKTYEQCRFIVSHIDGGITVSAHRYGAMIDGNVGAGGDGAYTPTRIGSVPVGNVLDYLENHSVDELKSMLSSSGGFESYFGTYKSDEIHKMMDDGNRKAELVWNGMIYQICKQIGAMSAVLEGRVDAILLTGGLTRFDDLVESVKRRCEWIAPVSVYVGEMEQETMLLETLRVLRGEIKANHYSGKPVWNGFDFD